MPPDPPTTISTTPEATAAAAPFDLAALARFLGCSTRHVWSAVHRGELPRPFHLGRRVLWHRGAVLAALDRLHEQAQVEPVRACVRRDPAPIQEGRA